MREASEVAQTALDDAQALWHDSGLTDLFSALVNTVWGKNIERHEPNELGDNAKTLGSLCAENLANRVQRRIAGSDYEPSQWNIDGLGFERPHGALRLSLAGKNFYVMKAPPGHGLTPQWDSLVNWDSESNTRQALAEATRVALEGYTSPGTAQPGLWPFLIDATAGHIRDFMVVWAGEQNPVGTAGWMTTMSSTRP